MDLLLNSHISITVKNCCFGELVNFINISYPPPPPPQKKCAFKSTCVLRTEVQLDWSSAHWSSWQRATYRPGDFRTWHPMYATWSYNIYFPWKLFLWIPTQPRYYNPIQTLNNHGVFNSLLDMDLQGCFAAGRVDCWDNSVHELLRSSH